MARKRIGELLIEAGAITEQQLAAALAYQQQFGGRIGRILVERKVVPEERLVRMLSSQLGIPVGDLPIDAPPPALLQLIPREVALSFAVFPVGVRKDPRGDSLFLAMADPTNIEVVEQVRLATGKQVMPFIAGELAIERAIEQWFPVASAAPPAPTAAAAVAPPVSAAPTTPDVTAPAPTAGPDGDELPLLTGVLSTPAKGVPAPAEVTATFGRPGSFLGDDNEEAEGAMPPPVDFDKLTLAGPAMLQPPSAAPEPELLEEVEPEPAAPADPVEPLELVEAEEVVAAPAPPALAASCPSCGAERIPSARFCPHCGCSFTGAPRAAATTPPVRVTGAVPLSSVSPTGDRGAGDVRAAREPSSLVLLAWHASSEAGRADDVDVLLGRATSGEPHLSPALGLVDLPSDAAWVDEPAALAGARAGETVGRAFAYVRRSANTDVDAPEVMLAAAPRKRSLAADWADVAERPIARKEHGTAELAVQRGRDLLLLATPEEEQPAAPAPEPEIAYEPAEPEHAANPAPWAAFAGAPDEKK